MVTANGLIIGIPSNTLLATDVLADSAELFRAKA
jgi:hypothetical protein